MCSLLPELHVLFLSCVIPAKAGNQVCIWRSDLWFFVCEYAFLISDKFSV